MYISIIKLNKNNIKKLHRDYMSHKPDDIVTLHTFD